MGISRTTLRFTDFHEGLTELSKAVMLPVLVYYSKRRTDKITKEKGKETGSRRDQVRASGCPLPAESQEQCFILSSVVHDNTQGITHQGSSPKPWCPGFLMAVGQAGVADCLRG